MNKIEIIKLLYEELTDEEKSTIYEFLNKDNIVSDEKRNQIMDFYSDEFIKFVNYSNDFRKQLYLLECGKINRIYYKPLNEGICFDNHDEAENYWEENFEKRMKMRYSEDSDEYQCFEILSSFDFDEVEEICKKLRYTYGIENRPITREKLIKDAVDMLRDLCSKDEVYFRQLGRLHAFKINYPKEDGGNYFSLLCCIESYDNAY